jgi:hypothetical protein
LKPTIKKKKVFTFRTDSSAEAEDWYETFKKGCVEHRQPPLIRQLLKQPSVHFSDKNAPPIKQEFPKYFSAGL